MNSRLYYRTTYGEWKAQSANFVASHLIPTDPTSFAQGFGKFVKETEVVVQVEASEGTHLSLESNPAWHVMSLLVAGTPLCPECVSSLAAYGITAADNMWTCAKKLAAIHPGLRATRF
jgi:hypothetical protein